MATAFGEMFAPEPFSMMARGSSKVSTRSTSPGSTASDTGSAELVGVGPPSTLKTKWGTFKVEASGVAEPDTWSCGSHNSTGDGCSVDQGLGFEIDRILNDMQESDGTPRFDGDHYAHDEFRGKLHAQNRVPSPCQAPPGLEHLSQGGAVSTGFQDHSRAPPGLSGSCHPQAHHSVRDARGQFDYSENNFGYMPASSPQSSQRTQHFSEFDLSGMHRDNRMYGMQAPSNHATAYCRGFASPPYCNEANRYSPNARGVEYSMPPAHRSGMDYGMERGRPNSDMTLSQLMQLPPAQDNYAPQRFFEEAHYGVKPWMQMHQHQHQHQHQLQQQHQQQRQHHNGFAPGVNETWTSQVDRKSAIVQHNTGAACRNAEAPAGSNPMYSLSAVLEELSHIDPECCIVVRRTYKLGVQAREVLTRHFSRFGSVEKVMLTHSAANRNKSAGEQGERQCVPSGLAFVHMSSVADTAAVLSQGGEQTVDGVVIKVQRFEQRCVRA